MLQKISRSFFSSMEVLQRTALNSIQKNLLKGKMVPFAGWEMPVQFTGIIDEHLHCRTKAGLFDVSHMGQVRIRGKDRKNFIESLCVSDVHELPLSNASLSLLTNDKGGIIDDCIITNLPDFLNIVVNASRKDRDLAHILKMKDDHWRNKDVQIEYMGKRSLIALQGPLAAKTLQAYVPNFNLSKLLFMRASFLTIPKISEDVLVSRCGYTGEDGFEISVSSQKAEQFFDLLLKTPDAKPCGLGARDTLRLEAGLCLYGHELDEEKTPIEASLRWIIGKRRAKKGGFPGADVIFNQMTKGVSIHRVGFVLGSGPAAREGTTISNKDESQVIGKISSGTFSPTLRKPIAMGYIKSGFQKRGTEVRLNVRGKGCKAVVSAMPFVPHKYFKK